jgi:hypothetical protein
LEFAQKTLNLRQLAGVFGETMVSGITEPQMFIGTSTTAFCAHQEDFNLPSVVQVHKGIKVRYFCF